MAKDKTLKSFLQRYRVKIARVTLLIAFAYVFGVERIAINAFDSNPGLVGIALLLLGVSIRSISAGMLHKNDILATEGIYAITRNPLYLGSLCMLIGFNVIVSNVIVAIVSLLLYLTTYIPTILKEERGLEQVYGEKWHAYTQSTPRLLPNILKLGELDLGQWNHRQWLKNHEHNSVLAVIAVLAMLYLYSRYVAV